MYQKSLLFLGKKFKDQGRGNMLHARFSLRETGYLLKELRIFPPTFAHLRTQALKEDMYMGLVLILL